ncbi:MAG: HAD family hydrolase [Candidatus Odinarchaeota archaeon]|nr:HAD family hydrolase [Candidatus Odinarchaeota archaeon]
MIAVLFDLDGTLLDSIDALVKAWIRVGKKLKIDIDPNLVREFIGASREVLTAKILGRADLIQKFSKIFPYEYSKIWRNEVKPYPEAHAVLKTLREMNVKTAIVSSNFRNTLECILNYFNFMPLIDAFVSNDDVEKGKPEPHMALEAIKRLGVHIDKCFVVGDTLFDVEMGKRAGLYSILLVRKPVSLAQSKYLPDYVISSLRDIISVIKNG